MYESVYNFKTNEPFLVPFSNIPFIYNGSNGMMMKGASCFALFILEEQGLNNKMAEVVNYIFAEDECSKEMSISSSSIIEKRFMELQNFFKEHFSFFANIPFNNKTELFVYTAFLDQLATDCFQFIKFEEPTTINYSEAYKHIDQLAFAKGLSKQEIEKYKLKLLNILSVEKPKAYLAITFAAA
ncbi:hypothetical protein [Priestia aryabhattai]